MPIDVVPGIGVRSVNPGGVRRFEYGELDGEVVPSLKGGGPTKVGDGLSLLFAHVVAVGFPGVDHTSPPCLAADGIPASLAHGVTDLVVIVDGILCLGGGANFPAGALADPQQAGTSPGGVDHKLGIHR